MGCTNSRAQPQDEEVGMGAVRCSFVVVGAFPNQPTPRGSSEELAQARQRVQELEARVGVRLGRNSGGKRLTGGCRRRSARRTRPGLVRLRRAASWIKLVREWQSWRRSRGRAPRTWSSAVSRCVYELRWRAVESPRLLQAATAAQELAALKEQASSKAEAKKRKKKNATPPPTADGDGAALARALAEAKAGLAGAHAVAPSAPLPTAMPRCQGQGAEGRRHSGTVAR